MAEVLSVGTRLGYGETPEYIAGITSMSIDGDTVEIDTTDYDVEDRTQRSIAGNDNPGEVTVTAKFDPTNFADIYAQVGVSQDWTVEFKDGSTWECEGYLKMPTWELEDAEDDGLVTNELSIKLSGRPVFTEAV